MRCLKRTAALATVAALVLGAGAALAGTAPSQSTRPVDVAAACQRAEHLLTRLQARAERVTARISALEQRIGSGELSPRLQARAEARLRRLEARLEKLEKRIERLEARIAEHCGDAEPA